MAGLALSHYFMYFVSIHPVDVAVAALAAEQYGAFVRRQVIEAGGDDALIRRRCASGRWVRLASAVYSLTGIQETYLRRLWVAHLTAGLHSAVSHESAAALLGLVGFPRRPLVLTVDHPSHLRIPGVLVHQISDVGPHHLWRLGRLPVTNTPRTIVDLASVRGKAALEIVLDDAIARRQVKEANVARCLFALLRPGKRGLVKLAGLLDERSGGHIPPMSELERRFFAALRAGGLPDPRRQFPLPGRGAITGIVDAAYPDAKLILETDGRTWHDRQRAFRHDRRRDNEAARVGWQTLRFPWEEVVNDPEDTAATVRDTRAQRLSRL